MRHEDFHIGWMRIVILNVNSHGSLYGVVMTIKTCKTKMKVTPRSAISQSPKSIKFVNLIFAFIRSHQARSCLLSRYRCLGSRIINLY